jgi:hypothetical protein
MKTSYFAKALITLIVIAATLSFKIWVPVRSMDRITPQKNSNNAEGKGFAVLELFTSEGCSSCPPADELIARIQKETEGESVYVLAYHVDYWDKLGWKDVFSSAEYSNRQFQYGRWLNVSPIYTPQVIVNGKTQFVGSDVSAIRSAILDQLKRNAVVTLTIQADREGGHLKLKYQAVNANSGSRVVIAIIQKSAQSKVLLGENAGHLLSHIQIVRKLQTERICAAGEGSTAVELPKDFNALIWEVVGFIQDQDSGEILAVAKDSM